MATLIWESNKMKNKLTITDMHFTVKSDDHVFVATHYAQDCFTVSVTKPTNSMGWPTLNNKQICELINFLESKLNK